MIKKILIAMAILAAFALGQSGQRMVSMGQENVDTPHGDGRMVIDYLHDTETKQEVVCVSYAQTGTSCYLTGRTW
jgi:hypothetical protein